MKFFPAALAETPEIYFFMLADLCKLAKLDRAQVT